MEGLPLETSSELSELDQLRQDYDLLLENLKLNAAVCVILLEQAGGVAEFTPDELASVDLGRSNVRLSHDEERNVYVVEGVYENE